MRKKKYIRDKSLISRQRDAPDSHANRILRAPMSHKPDFDLNLNECNFINRLYSFTSFIIMMRLRFTYMHITAISVGTTEKICFTGITIDCKTSNSSVLSFSV